MKYKEKVFILLIHENRWPEGWDTKVDSVYDTRELAEIAVEKAKENGNDYDQYDVIERFITY